MTSIHPYLIRAIHEWILDNGLTPYILVNTKVEGTMVPEQYIEGDRIIFNLSPSATKDLYLGNEEVEFKARFRGTPTFVRVPTRAILAVYAKETGMGMAFQEESLQEGPFQEGTLHQESLEKGDNEEKPLPKPPPKPPTSGSPKPSRPALRIVK